MVERRLMDLVPAPAVRRRSKLANGMSSWFLLSFFLCPIPIDRERRKNKPNCWELSNRTAWQEGQQEPWSILSLRQLGSSRLNEKEKEIIFWDDEEPIDRRTRADGMQQLSWSLSSGWETQDIKTQPQVQPAHVDLCLLSTTSKPSPISFIF